MAQTAVLGGISSLGGQKLHIKRAGPASARRGLRVVAAAAPKSQGSDQKQIAGRWAKTLPASVFAALTAVGPAAAAAEVPSLSLDEGVAAVTSLPSALPDSLPTVSEVKEPVDTAVDSVVNGVKYTGELVKKGLDAATVGADYAKDAYTKAAPVIKNATDSVTPYLKSGFKTATDILSPLVEAAKPTVQAGLQSGVTETEKLLSQSGVKTDQIVGAAKSASDAVTPYVTSPTVKSTLSQAFTTLTRTEPTVLGEYVLAIVGAYYLAPPVLKLLFGSLRGFAGEVSAAAALDTVSNQGNAYLVDIRTAREKEYGGVPDVPQGNKLIDLEYAVIEDRKVRSQLRNVQDIEVQVTALQIASLKKLNKGSTLLLLDRNGGQAKAVAKDLARRGFKRAFVVSGGFDGRGGWVSSKLQTKLSNSVGGAVEVLPPIIGTVFSGGNRSGTVASNAKPGRKALPSGR